jgi:hypothetical protein
MNGIRNEAQVFNLLEKLENEPMRGRETIPLKEKQAEDYFPRGELERDLKIDDLGRGNVYFIKSPTGSGKTSVVKQELMKEGDTVLIVCSTISIVLELCKLFRARFYGHCSGGGFIQPKISFGVTLSSFSKFITENHEFDLIVLDEWILTLMFTSSGLEEEKLKDSLYTIREMIRKKKGKVAIMDALLDSQSIRLLYPELEEEEIEKVITVEEGENDFPLLKKRNFDLLGQRTITIYNFIPKLSGMDLENFLIAPTKRIFYQEIATSVFIKKRRIVICTDHMREAQIMEKLLSEYPVLFMKYSGLCHEDCQRYQRKLKVIYLSSENRKAMEEFQERRICFNEIDVFMYTTVIPAGVNRDARKGCDVHKDDSCTGGAIKGHAEVFCMAGTMGIEDKVVQLAGRIRLIEEKKCTVFICNMEKRNEKLPIQREANLKYERISLARAMSPIIEKRTIQKEAVDGLLSGDIERAMPIGNNIQRKREILLSFSLVPKKIRRNEKRYFIEEVEKYTRRRLDSFRETPNDNVKSALKRNHPGTSIERMEEQEGEDDSNLIPLKKLMRIVTEERLETPMEEGESETLIIYNEKFRIWGTNAEEEGEPPLQTYTYRHLLSYYPSSSLIEDLAETLSPNTPVFYLLKSVIDSGGEKNKYTLSSVKKESFPKRLFIEELLEALNIKKEKTILELWKLVEHEVDISIIYMNYDSLYELFNGQQFSNMLLDANVPFDGLEKRNKGEMPNPGMIAAMVESIRSCMEKILFLVDTKSLFQCKKERKRPRRIETIIEEIKKIQGDDIEVDWTSEQEYKGKKVHSMRRKMNLGESQKSTYTIDLILRAIYTEASKNNLAIQKLKQRRIVSGVLDDEAEKERLHMIEILKGYCEVPCLLYGKYNIPKRIKRVQERLKK